MGPAAFAIPMEWAAEALVKAGEEWVRKRRGKNGLKELMQRVPGVVLTVEETDKLLGFLEQARAWQSLPGAPMEDLVIRIRRELPARLPEEQASSIGRASRQTFPARAR